MSISTPEKYRRRVTQPHSDEIVTEQAHKDTCDIHTIMRRYEKTGLIEHVNTRGAEYADYVGAPDFKEAMDYIANAKSLFESVPASIRDRFDNDPAKYLDFMTDENNRADIEALGLPTDHLPDCHTQPVSDSVATPSQGTTSATKLPDGAVEPS